MKWIVLAAGILITALSVGCTRGPVEPDSAEDRSGLSSDAAAESPAVAIGDSSTPREDASIAAEPMDPPTVEELANSTYSGFRNLEGPITLIDGQWAGEPFAPEGVGRPTVIMAQGFRVIGDLDGDGRDEAVVVLAQSSGGSGTYNYLAIAGRQDGAVRNLATVALGDRVAVRSARIEAGVLHVSVLRAGDDDAMCCPGELADLAWTLSAGQFVPAESAGVTGRLALEILGGGEWVLLQWDIGSAVPQEPEVTLVYDEGRFAGTSGCNRYFASVEEGSAPGDVTVGPVGTTRMACAEPAHSVEARYVQQLGGVRKYGFHLGRLALTYQREDGTIGTMLFEERL